MSVEEKINQSEWTKEQNKVFENCLARYAGEPNNRWMEIAATLTGKTCQEIIRHYEMLVEDVDAIESGCVPLPNYSDSAAEDTKNVVEKERRKGISWTLDEHRNFLFGLKRFGKGDWRSISRQCVPTRTPTQVASHAQKYFKRMESRTKLRKRNSIHDVTCEDEELDTQGPGVNTATFASGSSLVTEKSAPPFHPTVGSINGHMNEASAVVPFSVGGLGCTVVGPPSLPSLPSPSPTQTVYGSNAPLLNEGSIFDPSDVRFF